RSGIAGGGTPAIAPSVVPTPEPLRESGMGYFRPIKSALSTGSCPLHPQSVRETDRLNGKSRSASAKRSTVVASTSPPRVARGTSGLPAASVASDFKKQKSPTWWALRLHKPEDSIMFQHLALVARKT